jgi:hypothetical protein
LQIIFHEVKFVLQQDIYIYIVSNYIGMSFGLEKYGRLIIKRGKVEKTEGITLPEGHIYDVEEKYKYLGIQQSYGNHDTEVRRKATA